MTAGLRSQSCTKGRPGLADSMWSNSWNSFSNGIGSLVESDALPPFLRNQLISALLPRRMSGDLPWAGRSCNCHMRTGFNRNLSSNSGDRQRMHRAASAASWNFSIPLHSDATIHHPRPVDLTWAKHRAQGQTLKRPGKF